MSMTENARFQLEEYRFPRFTFDTTSLEDGELSIDFLPRGVFEGQRGLYRLSLEVRIGQGQYQVGKVECEASFHFSEEISLSSIPGYFYSNSIAIVFPYVRAFISLVTTQSQIPGIILPTLNLSGLGEKLKENTLELNGANNQPLPGCSQRE
ncbi:preprotein translocase, SecB subunit-like protein [Porphyromonas catoniae ATCC 51270]|uniref:Preprotein translocase, SecB subunit-like protein n=2 Tax=Porphyromonas catoniae TaxID=41976 RepID=Z4WZ27_9PORP|nr:preprotein translocase, SecB subunit-like protein [Porphyromonas catoniae ATCC 51270]